MDKQIGEVLSFHGHKLMVVEQPLCHGCFFENDFCFHLNKVIGDCEHSQRIDKKDVIFKCID